jgi:peptide/nickel transport system substrate-binding protein
MRGSGSGPIWTRRRLLGGAGAIVVAGAVSDVLAACGGGGGGGGAATAPAGTPKRGGTLMVAQESELRTLDPAFSTQLVEREVFYNVYESLVAIKPNLQIVPGLATSWSTPTPTTLVFKLRMGVKFHDGTDFNAAAVKWNLDRYMTATGSFRKPDLASVASVEATDPGTVTVRLKAPDASLLAQLVDRAGMMLSPQAVQRGGQDFARSPIGAGTGPFQFVEWKNGDHITIKRNPSYWRKGLPYLNQVVYHPITDTNSSLASLRTGDIDQVRLVSFKDVPTIKNDPSITYQERPGLGYDGIDLNRKGAFSDSARAKAVATAIDRPAIVKNTFFNVGPVSYGPISPASWAFDPSEQLYVKGDPAKAKKLATGFSFTLKSPNTPDQIQEAQLIKAQLAKAGITVSIQVEEFGQLLNETEAHQYDAAIVGWSGRIDPDGNTFGLFHTGAPNNDGQWSNTKFDHDVEQARATYDQAQRKKLYHDAQRALVGDVGYVFVHHNPAQQISSTKVRNFTLYPDNMWRFAEVWKA